MPWLCLHGVSTGDMCEALAALVGPEAAGLSAPVVSRFKARWAEEYQASRQTSLGKDRWVYLWAEVERLCAPVVIGTNERGEKHLLAIENGGGNPSKAGGRCCSLCDGAV